MLQRRLRQLVLTVLLAALAPLAAAQTVSNIRVMLHPYAAEPGRLPDAALTQLQTLAGQPLTLASTTRTGGLEFTLAQPLNAADLAALLQRLRNDRNVLWAEAVVPVTASRTRAMERTQPTVATMGRKLMVRLAGDPVPDWPQLLPRWSALAGASLTVDHQIGNVWVLTLGYEVPDSQLASMAAQLETEAAVQYADPVRRVTAKLVPNDPRYGQQWALSDPVAGVNAPTAWNLGTGSASVVVAVVDTGITVHPELAGRVLPGYDFIIDPGMANDGNGRDPDPSDPGDWTSENECSDGAPFERSSWHGTFVSGLIAANTNNAAGIAGMDWNAKILPVRVLGKCGGSFDDVTAGVLWAAGQPVAFAPANVTPARVINMSLGGSTACPQALQDAINAALAQGTVIAVAAGNESDDASNSAPANCSGVITVGASTRQGDRASYSNFGHRVDLSAPGGDGLVSDWIVSTSNDGITSPGNPGYALEIGTSFAAPHVAGTASLMFARNANLTPGQVLGIVTGTARAFPPGSACALGTLCGAGLLDAGLALQSTRSASDNAPPGTVAVIEYYRADKDHYIVIANPAEVAYFDAVYPATWQRTGEVFFAWIDPSRAPPNTPLQPVCRFYSPLPLIDSNLFFALANECQFVKTFWVGTWYFESPAAFYVLLPDANGKCPNGSEPVYRFFNNRNDANQRHTTNLAVRREMLNRDWAPDGIGPTGVAFCSPL
jgi:serine protease